MVSALDAIGILFFLMKMCFVLVDSLSNIIQLLSELTVTELRTIENISHQTADIKELTDALPALFLTGADGLKVSGPNR